MTYTIEQLKETERQASPSPWKVDPDGEHAFSNASGSEWGEHWRTMLGTTENGSLSSADAAFLEVFRTAVPELITEVETLRSALGKPIVLAIHELVQCASVRDVMIGELQTENERLRASVRNQSGDNLCWLKGDEAKIPPRAEFLESCARYHAQISEERGQLHGCLTIAQLEAEVQRLRDALEYVRCRWAKDLAGCNTFRKGGA